MTGRTPPDCRTCGACCLPRDEQDGWADVDLVDIERLTRHFRRKHVGHYDGQWSGKAIATKAKTETRGPLRGGVVHRCVALRGTPGERVSCSIYERRPDVCRTFRPGSDGCRDAHERMAEQSERLLEQHDAEING